jgi:hypothetical protein
MNVPPAANASSIQINDGSIQRSRVTSLVVTFSQIVNLPAAPETAFQLQRQSDLLQPALIANVNNTGPGTVVTLTFSGTTAVDFGSLADGFYSLKIFADKISNANGPFDGNGDGLGGDSYELVGDTTNKLFRLFGDADGNATVNSTDFANFRSFFGLGPSIFDYNNDGQTNSGDFAEFRKRFGITLVP